MRADAFGPHIEMAAQTERSRGAKKNTPSHCQWFFAMATVAVRGRSGAGRSKGPDRSFLLTFNEAITQLEIAAREHGLALENLLARLRAGAISKEQFVSEIRPLHEAFERIVEELTREAKSSALAAIASLKAPEPKAKN